MQLYIIDCVQFFCIYVSFIFYVAAIHKSSYIILALVMLKCCFSVVESLQPFDTVMNKQMCIHYASECRILVTQT